MLRIKEGIYVNENEIEYIKIGKIEPVNKDGYIYTHFVEYLLKNHGSKEGFAIEDCDQKKLITRLESL